MIPVDYKCGGCRAEGVKLWRKSATSEPVREQPLLCGDCTEREQGHPLNLSESDQCWGRCPAIPNLRGGWWQYTSVPAEGCAWWDALPLRLTGEWPVRGGVMRWMPYREALDLTVRAPVGGADLRRVDLHREGGAAALVFLPGSAMIVLPLQEVTFGGSGVIHPEPRHPGNAAIKSRHSATLGRWRKVAQHFSRRQATFFSWPTSTGRHTLCPPNIKQTRGPRYE